MRQLLVGHAPGKCRVRPAAAVVVRRSAAIVRADCAAQPLLVKGLERVFARDLLELGAQAADLGLELLLELGVLGLVGREVLLRLVQRDERVPDAAGELGLVGHLPRLERLEELKQQRLEVLRQGGRNVVEGVGVGREGVADLLELRDERQRRVGQLLLERAHRLEDVRRAVRDHESRQKDAHVDVLRGERRRRRAVAMRAKAVDALKARLGGLDHRLLAQEHHQLLEAHALHPEAGRSRLHKPLHDALGAQRGQLSAPGALQEANAGQLLLLVARRPLLVVREHGLLGMGRALAEIGR